jgi:uncharacterized membrane protein required for colicin V production
VAAIWVGSALVVLWFLIEGVRQGVVRRIVELVGLILVFVFASRLAGDVEPVLHDKWGMSARAAFFVSWAVVLVGGVFLVRLAATLSQKLVRLTITAWLDRIGGALMGALFGGVIVSCLLIGLLALPVEDELKQEIRSDQVTSRLLYLAPAFYDAVSGLWNGDGFFEMIREHVEPAARNAADSIRAVVEDLDAEAAGQ